MNNQYIISHNKPRTTFVMKQEIWHGDCLELMKNIPDKSVDAVICDLPYGTTSCKWDIIISFKMLWEEYDRICKKNTAIILFGQEPFTSLLRISNIKEWKYDWYWEKERLTNIAQVKKRAGKTIETISVFYKEQCLYKPQMSIHDGPLRTNRVKDGKMGKLTDSKEKKVFEYHDNGTRYPTQVLKFQRDCLKSNLHPTQKPVALLEYLIKTYTEENDLILDNCAGSGSTLIAAKNLNRQFIGIEKEKEYYDICLERLK
jgi:site-specific DNA-methyltransferase (adenine-specific)